MLGEKLGELRGKVTGQRVLPSDGPNPKVETSFEISGALLGADATMLGTYWSAVRPDGLLYVLTEDSVELCCIRVTHALVCPLRQSLIDVIEHGLEVVERRRTVVEQVVLYRL